MAPKAGDVVHFEINTDDPKRAKTFYGSVFG
jgi:predicted enzyme related to lactoylglutathione lyase